MDTPTEPKKTRETFDPPEEEEWNDFLSIKEDPLSLAQQIKIIDFAYKFRYATLKNNPSNLSIGDKSISMYLIIEALTQTKDYKQLSPEQMTQIIQALDNLPYSPIQLGETTESFQVFLDTLNNPALRAEEFGINASNYEQIYAAKLLLKSTFEAQLQVINDAKPEGNYNYSISPYGNSMGVYRHTLCDNDMFHIQTKRTISGKHRLLMRDDPIQKITSSITNPTPLDILLAHTHFTTGVWMRTWNGEDEQGRRINLTEKVQDREEYRQTIKNELTRLYDNPKTQHVIAALAEIMKETNGHLLLASTPLSTGNLGAIHGKGLDTLGFYDGSPDIVSAGIIYPNTKNITREPLGTIAHEALHLIFTKIIQNAMSPVVPNSQEETELDLAIAADKAYRDHIFTEAAKASFSKDEKQVWKTVVENLENEPSYFRDAPEATQKHTMRAEIIVRPIEQLASGCSEEAIQKIMPNVWEFYKKKCQPLIEAYVTQQQTVEGHDTSKTTKQYKSAITSLEHESDTKQTTGKTSGPN